MDAHYNLFFYVTNKKTNEPNFVFCSGVQTGCRIMAETAQNEHHFFHYRSAKSDIINPSYYLVASSIKKTGEPQFVFQ
jgi:hypothetical protein